MTIEVIQAALQRQRLDGWLFFDHHRRDPLAYRILNLPDSVRPTRRWYYFVPAHGAPRKLAHRIESGSLDSLPGEKDIYFSWDEQGAKIGAIIGEAKIIAMQYSPLCAIPYISMVDAGTIELVRSHGVEISSSANLVQEFEARWSDEQFNQHVEAGKRVDAALRAAFDLIRARVRTADLVTEFDVQQFILGEFEKASLYTDHGPIVAVNAHASDPHYEPTREVNAPISKGDLVLIDLWAKLKEADSVYYDVTWTGFCGETVPSEVQTVFGLVRDARKAATEFVSKRIAERQPVAGFEVDDAARNVIRGHGFGDCFFHRTGHSIGTEVHGAGANMDNIESHDDRLIVPQTCFSIEPGIYLPQFGIRSEVDVFAGEGFAIVTGEQQESLVLL